MRIGSIVTVALLSLIPASALAAETPDHHRAGINSRQHRQALRIRDGVQEGTINRAELDRLRADEAAIRAEERVYRQTGDGLTRPEVRDLQHDLSQTSGEIGRAKHNRASR
jgi:hypothetical protein